MVPALGATSPWESNVLLRPSRLSTWLNPVRASIETFTILADRFRDLVWQPLKTSLTCTLPCFQTCHHWFGGACRFLLSLFAILVEGAVSSFTERLPRLWTNTLPMVLKAESKTVIQPRASSLLHSLQHFAGTLVWEDGGPDGMLRRWWLSWSLKQILSRNFTHAGTKEHSWKSLWNSRGCVFSGLSDCVTPLTVAPQTPVSMEFSTQEYWSGLPFPTSGDLPDPGIKTAIPAFAGRFSIASTTWEAPNSS